MFIPKPVQMIHLIQLSFVPVTEHAAMWSFQNHESQRFKKASQQCETIQGTKDTMPISNLRHYFYWTIKSEKASTNKSRPAESFAM